MWPLPNGRLGQLKSLDVWSAAFHGDEVAPRGATRMVGPDCDGLQIVLLFRNLWRRTNHSWSQFRCRQLATASLGRAILQASFLLD